MARNPAIKSKNTESEKQEESYYKYCYGKFIKIGVIEKDKPSTK